MAWGEVVPWRDISAFNQGVRNANDAISLIQMADGALGVIDEKLIRMKNWRNRPPREPMIPRNGS